MLAPQDAQALTGLPRVSPLGWQDRRWVYALLLITDIIATTTGFVVAYVLRFQTGFSLFHEAGDPVIAQYRQLTILLVPTWLLVLAVFQLYDFQLLFGGMQEYARVFNACATGTMLVMVASFFLPELIIARGWLLLSWFSITALLEGGRFFTRRMVYRLRANGHFLTMMLIVGADAEGKAIAEQLLSNQTAGVRLVGFVDEHLPKGTEALPGLSVLGGIEAIQGLARQLKIREVTISSSALSRERVLEIFHAFINSDTVNVRLSSGLFEILTTGLHVKEIGRVPLLSVNRVRLTGADVVLKTVLDYVGATLGLLLLSPVFLLIAMAIKRSSPGPVFYRRRVVGVGGKRFDAFKFRTMVVDADQVLQQNPELKAEYEKNYKLKDDPRVTAVGRFLRKGSLDELPQLINVLRGEMSLVGPRMITADECAKYGKWRLNLHTVKPGITGLWQINGRSDVDYENRVRLDMYYIRNYSIWLDLHILFQTLPAVLRKRGAY